MPNNSDAVSAHEHATWQGAAETYAENMSLVYGIFRPNPTVDRSG